MNIQTFFVRKIINDRLSNQHIRQEVIEPEIGDGMLSTVSEDKSRSTRPKYCKLC